LIQEEVVKDKVGHLKMEYKKKILITGGNGFLGSHMTQHLISNNFEVDVIDRKNHLINSKLEVNTNYIGDLQNFKFINKILKNKKYDGVFHFAGSTNVGESNVNPIEYYKNNVTASLNLIEAMTKTKTNNLIFSSTASVYGNNSSGVFKESDKTNPLNVYGQTKFIVENIIKASNIKSICLRYFNACGSDYKNNLGEIHKPETHLIPLLMFSLLNKTNFFVNGKDYKTEDGTCIRDFIHVKDLCDAHLKALEFLKKEEKKFNIFNLGFGKGFSILEIINIIENQLDVKINYEFKNRRKGDPPKLIADITKARDILKWIPSKNINDIINDTFLFYRRNIKWI
jgi:UDP-glucose 4-epimerase